MKCECTGTIHGEMGCSHEAWARVTRQGGALLNVCDRCDFSTDLASTPLVDASAAVVVQPPPTPNGHPAVWDLVLADIGKRDAFGERKYGVRLQPNNGRDYLADAYQEALDLVVYLRGAIYERDGK